MNETTFKIGDKVGWRWTFADRLIIKNLKREYGNGPFLVVTVYSARYPYAGHPQILILKTELGAILQKQGHSPGAHISGKLLKKV